MKIYFPYLKRFVDIILSVASLIALSPLIFLVSALIYLEDRGPIIFCQHRIGQNGRKFLFFKFRSMRVGTANLPSDKLGTSPITKTGHFIRRYSIDEIPQLFNIIKGDMSIVGPRPALLNQEYLTKLRKENGSLSLKPGLTGLAQINSYNGMPETVKANFDGKYRAKLSALLDGKIILLTLKYLTTPPPVY